MPFTSSPCLCSPVLPFLYLTFLIMGNTGHLLLSYVDVGGTIETENTEVEN